MTALPEFSTDQWRFLAAVAAFDESVPVNVVGELEPLAPGPLFDLLSRAESLGWLEKTDMHFFQLNQDLPPEVSHKIDAINTPDRFDTLIQTLNLKGHFESLSKHCRAHLLHNAGRYADALKLKLELAIETFRQSGNDHSAAYFVAALDYFEALSPVPQLQGWFPPLSLEFSQIVFSLGIGFAQIGNVLEHARNVALSTGDQRSWALVNLYLGQVYYLNDHRAESLDALLAGKQKVEELGDTDILEQAAEFLGLYYAMRGLLRESVRHLENALKRIEEKEADFINPLAPILLGYCEAYLGQFHRAIGHLDCQWHLARQNKNYALANTLRAALGTILLLIKRKNKALHHLESAREEALREHNYFALYLASGGIAYYHFLEGDLPKVDKVLAPNWENAAATGIVYQYASPWVLEMLYELDSIENSSGHTFDDMYAKALADPNIHLRGVALRLKAAQLIRSDKDKKEILKLLNKSEQYLQQAGDPVQLAKTHLEIAQVKLKDGNLAASRLLARQARKGLSGYWGDLFPDGLRFLLEDPPQNTTLDGQDASHEALIRFLENLDLLIPKPNFEEVLYQVVSVMNRFFFAERGALFWFGGKKRNKPELRAARNILRSEVESKVFEPFLELVIQTRNQKRPMVILPRQVKSPFDKSILCIPIEINHRVQGVLYFDNSYLDNCFDFANKPLLAHITRHLTSYIQKVWQYIQMMDTAAQSSLRGAIKEETLSEDTIHFQSSSMDHVITSADRVARSGASILILGESGVGKELLAKWLHKKSHRNHTPLVIVDPTTIPENLIESELFGYEKGAFTGADHQKKGRIELAHDSTLFIDEIGEIPLNIQTKFLRVLQEKTFTRVGGTQNLEANFRLLTATNRDLAEEVRAGRFREDLYYRINVLELTIPPLRDRREDILLLAHQFLGKYTKKYNRMPMKISSASEKLLQDYAWPGNVRELQNVIERAVLLSSSEHLELNLPSQPGFDLSNPFADMPTLEEVQRRYIKYVLSRTDGRVGGTDGAAERLGMKRTTLHSRMSKLGIKNERKSHD